MSRFYDGAQAQRREERYCRARRAADGAPSPRRPRTCDVSVGSFAAGSKRVLEMKRVISSGPDTTLGGDFFKKIASCQESRGVLLFNKGWTLQLWLRRTFGLPAIRFDSRAQERSHRITRPYRSCQTDWTHRHLNPEVRASIARPTSCHDLVARA